MQICLLKNEKLTECTSSSVYHWRFQGNIWGYRSWLRGDKRLQAIWGEYIGWHLSCGSCNLHINISPKFVFTWSRNLFAVQWSRQRHHWIAQLCPLLIFVLTAGLNLGNTLPRKLQATASFYAVETGGERRAVGPTCSLSLRVRINVHDSKTEVHQNCKYRIPGEVTASAIVSWIWNHMILSYRLQVCGASRTPRNLNS